LWVVGAVVVVLRLVVLPLAVVLEASAQAQALLLPQALLTQLR
jgi:hypothetical protein